MKVAFDNSFLTLLFNKKSAASVPNAAELVDDLVTILSKDRAKIIIPAPVLTEVLIRAGKTGPRYIETLKPYACFQVRPFDEKAAVELAEVLTASIGTKRSRKDVSAAKITFDRQIVAIARAHGAEVMYSDDRNVRAFAEECGLDTFGLSDLKLTPKQESLPYEQRKEIVAGSPKLLGSGDGSAENEANAEATNQKPQQDS